MAVFCVGMSQPNPNQAQAGAGAESEHGAPQGEPTDSLNSPGKEQSFDERLTGATSQSDVLRIIDDAKAGRLRTTATEATSPETDNAGSAQGGTEGTEGAEAAATGENAEGAEAGAGEETATAEGAGDQAGESGAGENAEGAEGAEGAGDKTKTTEEEDEGKIPDRIRLAGFSDVERLALQLKKTAEKAGQKISLAEAEKRAKAALGIAEESEQAAGAGSNATPGLPKTVAEVDAKIAELKAARTKARTEDLDFKEADRLDNEIDALKEHKLTLREQTVRQASEEQKAYDTAFDAAQAKASSLYDFVKQADSAGFKRMAEIDRTLEANKDPLFNDPEKPLRIAQMVAKELNIAPKAAGAKPAAGKPAVTARPAVQTLPPKKTVPPVASGTSRTSTTSNQGDAFSKQIDSAKSVADLEKLGVRIG